MYKIVLNYEKTGFNLSDIVWFLSLWISTIVLLLVGIIGMKDMDLEKSYIGTVKYKFEDQLSDRVNRKLIVKFDSVKEPVEFIVSSNAYFSVKQGDRTSFKMTKREANIDNKFRDFIIVSCLVFGFIEFLILFFFNCYFIGKLFTNYSIISTKRKEKEEKISGNWWINKKKLDPYGEENWDN